MEKSFDRCALIIYVSKATVHFFLQGGLSMKSGLFHEEKLR